MYVKGDVAGYGSGTRNDPFKTIDAAMVALDGNGATDKSENTICVMGNLDVSSYITVAANDAYYNIVGYDDYGLVVTPVELTMSSMLGSVIEVPRGT
ncbi:MAG: hypothetical protein J5700_05110, partial [Treponema sp.]|nr:hypothetical protein [Treponema sp.]